MKNKFKNITLERAYDIVKKPITTEKSTNLQQFNQYSFIVSKSSNSLTLDLSLLSKVIVMKKVLKLRPN